MSEFLSGYLFAVGLVVLTVLGQFLYASLTQSSSGDSEKADSDVEQESQDA